MINDRETQKICEDIGIRPDGNYDGVTVKHLIRRAIEMREDKE